MTKLTSTIEQNESPAIDPGMEAPFVNLLKLFLSKWWVFVIVGILFGIAGILYAANQKPKFESRLTFSLDAGASDGGLSGAMSLAAQFGFGLGTAQSMFDGDNILEIMKSRRMIESVLLSVDTFEGKPFTLIDYYMESSGLKKRSENNRLLKDVSFPAGSKKGAMTYLQDSILYNVYQDFSKENLIAARPDRKFSIYEVKVTSMDEKFSKVFTDKIVEETIRFYTEISSKKDRETLEILEQRVASLRSNVGSSIDTRASSQDANINPAFASAQSPLLKVQYNMQAYGEAYKEMFKTLEIARYQYLKKMPLLQVIDHADYPMKKIKPGKLSTGLLFSVFSVLFSILIIWVLSFIKK
ncbi:MAG: hypothetical protein ABI707_03120 [Ferruginibacter sp.]